LVGRPVIVLSNNDGCAIARSNEAKELGVKMGQPWFQIQHLQEEAGLVALSANFPLYGDMSDRMMSIAAGLGPGQEIYSIDEAFSDLSGVQGDLTRRAQAVRARVLQWIGIPCCVGIGPTKTLAKLGNHVAKSAERKPGSYPAEFAQVCNLAALPESDLDALLKATPVGEVWGIGRRIEQQLQAEGVSSAYDFVQLRPSTVRKRWSVVLEKTLRELQGEACISLEESAAPRKQIACTRSFGRPVTELDDLIEAVSEFAGRAAEKLRHDGSHAGQVLVFIRTSPFRQAPQYSRTSVTPLIRPTADTMHITLAAIQGLKSIFAPGYQIAKAGVMLLDLQPQSVSQGELDFGEESAIPDDRSQLMMTIDKLNQRYGKGIVHAAASGTQGERRVWTMRQLLKTPEYTTMWSDIPIARA